MKTPLSCRGVKGSMWGPGSHDIQRTDRMTELELSPSRGVGWMKGGIRENRNYRCTFFFLFYRQIYHNNLTYQFLLLIFNKHDFC